MTRIPEDALQIAEMKGGKLFQHEKVLYFLSRESKVYVYEISLLDYMLEWGQRNLAPDEESLKLIKGVNSFSPNQHPVSCSFKNGMLSDYCIIEFIDHPPSSYSMDWYYYDDVKSVTVSDKVVSNEMVDKMVWLKKKWDNILEK